MPNQFYNIIVYSHWFYGPNTSLTRNKNILTISDNEHVRIAFDNSVTPNIPQ